MSGRRTPAAALALAAAALLAGCGEHGGAGAATSGATTVAVPASTSGVAASAGAPPPGTPVPEEQAAVVRRWSAAINANDNAAAAALFVPGALIYGPEVVPLPDVATATAWNAGFPCGGDLVDLRLVDGVIVGTFLLTERPEHVCDGPGDLAGAAFDVRDGRIIAFARTAPYGDGLDDDPGTTPATTDGLAL